MKSNAAAGFGLGVVAVGLLAWWAWPSAAPPAERREPVPAGPSPQAITGGLRDDALGDGITNDAATLAALVEARATGREVAFVRWDGAARGREPSHFVATPAGLVRGVRGTVGEWPAEALLSPASFATYRAGARS